MVLLQFARLEDARAAESLNGQLEIAGRAIKVTLLPVPICFVHRFRVSDSPLGAFYPASH